MSPTSEQDNEITASAGPADQAPVETLVILGAGGDLTSRLLLPGLGSYLASSRGTVIRLIGTGRHETTDARWREQVGHALAATPSALADEVVADARFLPADATVAADLERVLAESTGRTALYFALPPAAAVAAVAALAEIALPDGIVLAFEKPFGTDLASARELNRRLETLVEESQVFRVDHFLGKSTVLNVLGIRFANRIFEPLLSAQNVERVEIVIDEELGLEGRAGYYDSSGALVDMIQSHLLLVLALATMEPPSSLDSTDLRGAMSQLLHATRAWDPDGTASRRARYTAGEIDGRELPAYTREEGVSPRRRTETLAEMTVAIDTWRWASVPFTLRSGKALGGARQEIVFTFRDVPHLPTGFTPSDAPVQLRIGLKPAVLELDLRSNGGEDPFALDIDVLRTEYDTGELTPYGEVLAAMIEGDSTLSVRGDVAEECWRIVAPVIEAWAADRVPIDSYPAGSTGPRGWG